MKFPFTRPKADDHYRIETPFGFAINYFRNHSFCLCPETDRSIAECLYSPTNVAHWLVAEGWGKIWEPDFTWEGVMI
jgi:hypothetical protein